MSRPRAYYNEHDPFAAAWLRELIAAGEIMAGDVDERDIQDVHPSDVVGYTRCHWFAGIAGWDLALRLAGWPDDEPIWTGSAPCQPFSAAGKRGGAADERHLWPAFHWLIAQCRPRHVIGEQVAAAVGMGWWDLVATDLEGIGYACAAVDLPAASVGAPHKRSRLFFVAHADQHRAEREGRTQLEPDMRCAVGLVAHACRERCDRESVQLRIGGQDAAVLEATGRGGDGELADTTSLGWQRWGTGQASDEPGAFERPERLCAVGELGNTSQPGLQGFAGHGHDRDEPGWHGAQQARPVAASGTSGHWADCDWIYCRDGKWRATQQCIQPLVAGLSRGVVPSGDPSASDANATTEARVGRLRGYGNSIVPQVGEEVIRAYMETRQ